MLSAEFDADTRHQAIDRGAAGFIPKTSVTNVLVSALKLIMAGGIYVPPEVLQRDRAPAPRSPRRRPCPDRSAGRRRQADRTRAGCRRCPGCAAQCRRPRPDRPPDRCPRLADGGKSNKQISRELDLAEATVKVHVRSDPARARRQFRTEAVVAALTPGPCPLARRQPDSGPQ
jgi:DNA-binding NarL/FixJ family response regulator